MDRALASGAKGRGFESLLARHLFPVQSGEILYRTFRGHSLHSWAKRVLQGLQGFFLQIDVTEIIVHKADKPDTLVDLFDAYRLTRERSAEIYFLFENADPSAVGNQSCPIVKRIREFSDAPIWPRGSLINFARAFHIESLMRALVVKHLNESIELGLLLKEVGTGGPGSFHL